MAGKMFKKLEKITLNRETNLERYVAQTLLEKVQDYGSGKLLDADVESVFQDLFHGGCASGFIGELIYTSDAQKFYDEFYDDIENLIAELEESIGEPIHPKKGDDRKNFYAWFGFEEQARLIADKIGLEV